MSFLPPATKLIVMVLLDPNARPVIAHRGNRAFAPENTLEALQQAVALGADAVEFDLRVTRDSVLVVHHDATLERTTDGHGGIATQTVGQLRQVDAGARFTRDGVTFPWRGRGVPIPTFDEIIEALPRTLPLIVELKDVAAGPLMREAIRRHGIAERIIVAGFASESTRPLRGLSVAIGASTTDVLRLLPRALCRRPVARPAFQALCLPPVHRGLPVPIGALVRAVRPHGVVTHVWTVNDAAAAHRLWRRGVNGIITDDPASILRARDGR